MAIRVNDLKKLVDEELANEQLRSEIKRTLGASVLVEGKIAIVARDACDRLEVLSRSGRPVPNDFDVSSVSRASRHADPRVRELAARLGDCEVLRCLLSDKDDSVVHAAAHRADLKDVREALDRRPDDDQLRSIYEKSRLKEDRDDREPMTVLSGERAPAVKQANVPELSDLWYDSKAALIVSELRHVVEPHVVRMSAHRFVSSTKATSGVEVDEAKLLKAIEKLVEEREDEILERDALRETIEWLERRELNESHVFQIKEDEIDPVRELVESGVPGKQFLDRAFELFSIEESQLPATFRKWRLEEKSTALAVPIVGRLPHAGSLREVDERALDEFVTRWTANQEMHGEPFKLSWSPHPLDESKISFNVILK